MRSRGREKTPAKPLPKTPVAGGASRGDNERLHYFDGDIFMGDHQWVFYHG